MKSAKYDDDDKIQWYTVTYEIQIDNDNQTFNGKKIIDLIDRVVYKRDERWWSSRPSITSVNRKNNFRRSFNVWGSTNVTAEVHVYGLDSPLIREGYMSLGVEPKLLDRL